MRKIAELAGRQLNWVQPRAFTMEYELRAGDELAATLRFLSRFSSHAVAECANGCWMFERVGFWRSKVAVRACDEKTDIAVFSMSKWGDGGGVLELSGGQKLYAAANFLRTEYEFKGEANETLLRLSSDGIVRLSAKVDIRHRAERLPEFPWLVALGWYLVLQMRRDATSGA